MVWEVKKLNKIGKIFSGNSINAKIKKEKYLNIDSGIPYVATKDISYDSIIDYDNGVKIPANDLSNFRIANKNSILICAEGGSAGRKIAFNTQNICFVNKLFALEPFDFMEPKYVFYFYNTSNFQEQFKSKITGLIGGVSKGKFKEIEIPVPPLPVQKQIVDILDEAFEKISKAKENTEKNLKNSKEVFESYLQSVFENKGEDWEEKKLGELANVIGGYSFKSSNFKKKGKYQVIRMGNVRPGIIKPNQNPVFINDLEDKVLKKALLLPNDVIITQTGTKKKRDYGFTTIINKKDYLLNQRIAAIRFSEKYLPKFFLYFSWTNLFKDQYFANETGTVGQGNVGIGAITGANIPFLSLEEQKQIVSKLDLLSQQTKKLESVYTQKLTDLEELKQSILQKAFSGELVEVLA